MSKILLSIGLLLFSITTWSQTLAGQECFPTQDKSKVVYDVADALNAADEAALEKDLELFAVNSSNEIFVVIVPDLCGMDKGQFAIELGEKFGVGQKNEDNGVTVLIKPKQPDSKGEIFIAIGRGLEPVITDIATKNIIENEMIPEFRNNNMAGINAGIVVLKALATGEYNSDEYANHYKSAGKAGQDLLF